MTSNQPCWLTMPPAEVAAAILPLFSDSPAMREEAAMARILSWCGAVPYRPKWKFLRINDRRFEDPDARAIAEAIHALDRAGLLMRTIETAITHERAAGGLAGEMRNYVIVGLTRLGWHALQTNTVRQYLGLGDAAPT
jgi:hypothetical protein